MEEDEKEEEEEEDGRLMAVICAHDTYEHEIYIFFFSQGSSARWLAGTQTWADDGGVPDSALSLAARR